MRKIFSFMFVTADGFFEGPNHDISWHNFDEEFSDLSIKQLNEIGTLIAKDVSNVQVSRKLST